MSMDQGLIGRDRRTFLKQLAVVGGAWAVGACQASGEELAVAPSLSGWADRVGVQLYTVRDQMEKDLPGTLERVAEIGYKEVELAGLFGHDPYRVRALLDRLGLRAPSAHVSLEELRRDLAGQMHTARVLGNQYITVPALSEAFTGGTMDLAFWQRLAAASATCAGSCRW